MLRTLQREIPHILQSCLEWSLRKISKSNVAATSQLLIYPDFYIKVYIYSRTIIGRPPVRVVYDDGVPVH